MFGSDWPVSLLAGASYRRIYDSYKQLVNHLTPDEIHGIFGRNATQFYKLDVALNL